MPNSATVLGSLGLSVPGMENGEMDTAVSDEKALGLSSFSRKRQVSRSGRWRSESGWCRNARTLEEQRAGTGEGPSALCPGVSGS